MKRLALLFVTSFVGLFALNANATASSSSKQESTAQLQAQLKKVSAQAEALESEVQQLSTEIHQRVDHRITERNGHVKEEVAIRERVVHRGEPGEVAIDEPAFEHPPLHHIITVSTSPILNVRNPYDLDGLLSYQSSMNEDLILLENRQKVVHYFDEHEGGFDRPIIVLGGQLAGQILYSNGFGGAEGDVNLSTAELNLNAIISPWLNGYFSLNYDSSPSITGTRTPNSRIYLERGFINIGNLDVSPFYFTVGQFYMPFGRYSSSMATTPLTESVGRILARGVLIGYKHNGFYAQLYTYDGSMDTRAAIFKQGGINAGFKHKFEDHDFAFNLGAGVVSNIADSEGMQNNGFDMNGFFNGFGESTVISTIFPPPLPSTETTVKNFNNLRHRVPAIDGHARLTFGHLSLVGEYISVLTEFDPADMTFNDHPAAPKALHAELDYAFHIHDKPSALFLGYGHTWQALALNLPEQSFFIGMSTSLLRDTVESIEFRHDINYSSCDVSTGGTAIVNDHPMRVVGPNGNSGTRNLITAGLQVYF